VAAARTLPDTVLLES